MSIPECRSSCRSGSDGPSISILSPATNPSSTVRAPSFGAPFDVFIDSPANPVQFTLTKMVGLIRHFQSRRVVASADTDVTKRGCSAPAGPRGGPRTIPEEPATSGTRVPGKDRKNNQPIRVVGGVLVWSLSGSLSVRARTIRVGADAVWSRRLRRSSHPSGSSISSGCRSRFRSPPRPPQCW